MKKYVDQVLVVVPRVWVEQSVVLVGGTGGGFVVCVVLAVWAGCLLCFVVTCVRADTSCGSGGTCFVEAEDTMVV